jgi:tripartite-type tricarboxylate transporter receptor subunit TctC
MDLRRPLVSWSLVGCVLLGLLTACSAAPAARSGPAASTAQDERQAVEAFYKGKTVRIVVGAAPGGGYDAYARILARHLGKYIPGNPTVIVENMPGAGMLIAANHIYNVAPKDGTVIGNFDEYLTLGQMAGQQGIEFDARQFNWVGNPGPDPIMCAFRSDLGFNTFEELLRADQEIIVGSVGAVGPPYSVPAALNAVTGTRLKTITGYRGTSEIRVAVERKETDGLCWGWSSIKATAQPWFEGERPFARLLVQTGRERHKELPDVPLAQEFVKHRDKAQMLDIVTAAAEVTRPYTLPPGVPAERARAIREAFLQGFNDPEARSEAERAKLLLEPQGHEVIERAVQRILAIPPEEGRAIGEALGLR